MHCPEYVPETMQADETTQQPKQHTHCKTRMPIAKINYTSRLRALQDSRGIYASKERARCSKSRVAPASCSAASASRRPPGWRSCMRANVDWCASPFFFGTFLGTDYLHCAAVVISNPMPHLYRGRSGFEHGVLRTEDRTSGFEIWQLRFACTMN